ncbi:MAG TPA: MBL fold metallo-hydrolase [Vicinamibacterales bacterium]|nr:MBL fold metallo-hydrolase [Vicinamibacterales bacterium]
MRRAALVAATVLLLLIAALVNHGGDTLAAQGPRPAGTTFSGKAFRFNKVKDGVYHAVGTGALTVVGNSTVLVNDRDVIVVDDHVSPAAAWVLLEEIKSITDKPVTTVVNTHFHFDHAHGNQIFAPGVQIIGHEFTRRALLDDPVSKPLYQSFYSVKTLEGQIENLRKRIASEQNAAARDKLQTQLTSVENNYASQKELRPTPPNVTLTTQMTLFRGDREIQIRYLGRGHTAGDVVVYLPKEKAVITGDLLTASTSNLSDSYPVEWAATLEELKKLDFDTVIPGHGEAFTDKAKIDYFAAYLRDVWSTVGELKKQGVSAEEAAKRADLSKHKERFPNPAVPVIGVQRIYALLDGSAR